MKQIKKNRKKKKKENNNNIQNEEIKPTKHEKVGNINFYSEEVAKYIIEKLLSNVVSNNFKRNAKKKMNNFCVDEMFQKYNILFELCNINHENDDFATNKDIVSNIKYNNTDSNEKRYKIIDHNTSKINSYSNAERELIKIINTDENIINNMIIQNKKIEDYLNKSTITRKNSEIKTQNNIYYDIVIDKKNFWGNITEPKNVNIDRTSNKFNNLIKDQNIIVNDINNIKESEITKEFSSTIKSTNTFNMKKFQKNYINSLNSDNQQNNKKEKKPHLLKELPFYEIPSDQFKVYQDQPNIAKIRKETIEYLKQKKEQELKLLIKRKKRESLKLQSLNNIRIRGKFTVDVDGKIVFIRELKPENFPMQFSPVNSKLKENNFNIKNKKQLKKQKRLSSYSKIPIEKNPKINYIVEIKKPPKINNDKSDNKKPNNEPPKKLQDTFIFSEENISDAKSYFFQKEIPSGSNFKIIVPSTGVLIKEDHNTKVGNLNFYDKYHKFSMKEFNKNLEETLELEKTKNKFRDMKLNNKIPIINEEKGKELKSDIKDKKDFEKAFINRFHIKKKLCKSNSTGIFVSDEKYSQLKEIMFNDDTHDKKLERCFSGTNNQNLFKENINNKSKNKNKNNSSNNIMRDKNIYNAMDKFNKDLIMGRLFSERTLKEKAKLPKLPLKIKEKGNTKYNYKNLVIDEKENFNKSMSVFYRTRQKTKKD